MDKSSTQETGNLEQEIQSIKKAFEVLLLAIEAEGIESAAEIAGRIMSRLDHVVKEIKSGYVQTVLQKKFAPLADDHQKFAALAKEPAKHSEEFIDLVSRLEQHIATVDHEMRLLMPQEFWLLTALRRHWKKAAIVAASVLVVAGIWNVASVYLTQGKGLIGEYYSGTNFRKLVKKRRDLTIDFSLRNEGPVRGLPVDNYSVRWTGFLRVPEDGTYEFTVRSDDGVRLWLNEESLVDNWTIHRQATDKATRELQAGTYPIKLEWFQRRGPATMQLYWRSGRDAQPRLIEPEYLLPKAD